MAILLPLSFLLFTISYVLGVQLSFLRKLFQSTQLYIKGILRWLASKSAWQIVVSLPDDLAMKLVGGVTSVNVKHLRT